jgi:putative oxidoreductase
MLHDRRVTDPSGVRLDLALIALRIASSSAFLYHGSGILFGAFVGPGPREFAESHGWPVAVAYLVGLAQVLGAVAVLTGTFARVGAVCLVIVMMGAIVLVHLPHGFDVSNGGLEYALTQMLVATAIFLTGPGHYSLARLMSEPWSFL